MKSVSKILAAITLTVVTGIGTNSYAEPVTTTLSELMAGIGMGPQAMGAVGVAKVPVKFNIYNATLVNNTFGIRVDRPLDKRLYLHALTTIDNLLSQGRITNNEADLLMRKVNKYTNGRVLLGMRPPIE